jgi:hypothetical protein
VVRIRPGEMASVDKRKISWPHPAFEAAASIGRAAERSPVGGIEDSDGRRRWSLSPSPPALKVLAVPPVIAFAYSASTRRRWRSRISSAIFGDVLRTALR